MTIKLGRLAELLDAQCIGDDDLDSVEIFQLKLTRSGLLVDVVTTHDDWNVLL